MEREYTQQNIDQFFNHFKALSKSYKFEKVHQLINNPDAKATQTVKLNHKPFKFIIMTSAILIGLSALFILVKPNRSTDKHISNVFLQSNDEQVYSPYDTINREEPNPNLLSVNNDKNTTIKEEGRNESNVDEDFIKLFKDNGFDFFNEVHNNDCDWPEDTVIDKHSLFVYLSKEEVLKLGVYLTDSTMNYENRIKKADGTYRTLGLSSNWTGEAYNITNYAFYIKHSSDTACTKYRWGHEFYQRIDTLIPVVINWEKKEPGVLWFTPHRSIFTRLPERYKHLEKVYANLKCLKENNPQRQYTNFWNKERNIILDEINYLILSKEELKNIGIKIFEDSISLRDVSGCFKYDFSTCCNNYGTWAREGVTVPEIPFMFPTLLTDIKGLKQATWGAWMKNKGETERKEVFNILIPVLLPVSELIQGKDYQLILWYYPTEEFLNALPDRYRNSIKAEIDYISSGTVSEDANCNYFEVCKSTLQLDNFKLYPNPAKNYVTLEFSYSEVLTGSISIVNIAGAKIKEVLPTTTFFAGPNSYELDLSGISSGIYLLSINTDKGFKTQRIIMTD